MTTTTVQHADAAPELAAIRAGIVAPLGTVAANELPAPAPATAALPTARDEFLALIADGKFFGLEFTKRDGSTRHMQARLGVTRHLAGGTKAYDDVAKGIVTVFSTDAGGYRSVRLDSIRAMTVRGTTYLA